MMDEPIVCIPHDLNYLHHMKHLYSQRKDVYKFVLFGFIHLFDVR